MVRRATVCTVHAESWSLARHDRTVVLRAALARRRSPPPPSQCPLIPRPTRRAPLHCRRTTVALLSQDKGQKEKPVLEFGKYRGEEFCLDVSYPFSPFTAFAIALTAFDVPSKF